MKTPFFLFIAFSTLSLSSGQRSPAPVRDANQNFLLSGTNYYIVPVVRGTGGGVTLAPTRNQTCPLDVVQRNNEQDNGDPVTFTPANAKKGTVIYEFTDLNIKFPGSTPCVQSTVWRLEDYQGNRVFTTGGVLGNPGRETLNNWFKIQKHEDYYKLVFCPSVCSTCRLACGDVGTTISKNGRRRLVLSKVPLKIMFKKA